MKRCLFLFIYLLIVGLIACEPVPSEVTVEIQSPAIEKQQTEVWCWAASIQNALSSYQVVISQEEVVMTTYGRVVNLPLFNAQEAVANLFQNNYRLAPQGKVVHPFFVNGPPIPSVLIRELGREKSPLLVFYQNPQGGGHVVVCYGARYTGTASNPTITTILVKDPWEAENKAWPGVQLASLWKSTIFLRVAPKPKSSFFYNGVPYLVTPTYEVVNQYSGFIDGRVWYFNELRQWHIFDNYGNDLGPIP